jgi:predicted membrane protein (TIGR00267 family)
LLKRLQGWLRKVKVYLDVTRARGIARRYFVMNGFDGSMTMFGIIIGSWVTRVTEAGIIVAAGLGACLAMGVSGFFGAFMAEKAERKGHLRTLEAASNQPDSIHYEASRFVSVYVALIDGISPTLTALVSLAPFIFTRMGLLSIGNAYIISLILAFATLFSLGFYLGRIARERVWLYGAQMVAVGIITAIIIFLLETII